MTRNGLAPRLPGLLRSELARLDPPIDVFNPRGQDFSRIDLVELLGGFVLECLDPAGQVQALQRTMSNEILGALDRWRDRAIQFADAPSTSRQLVQYAVGWADRDPGRTGEVWPREVSALDLLYDLASFFPELYDDPEGQVYLEVFARQLTVCRQIGRFSGRVIYDPDDRDLSNRSVRDLLWNFLGPIAGGVVGVDEDLLEAFPRRRLSVLSIHQAKGLEFPLTIVDAGADFNRDYQAQARGRFPRDGNVEHRLEDDLRAYSDLLPPARGQVDRAFDDRFRQFFVAYSRPQDVLLLAGVEPAGPAGNVPNVATGWDRRRGRRWPPAAVTYLPI